MPNVEVDQGEYEASRRAQSLLNALLEDPRHGLDVKKIVKAKFPEARIPDLELINQVKAPYDEALVTMRAENEALRKMIEEDRSARAVKEAEGNMRSSLDSIRTKYGFTDEGVKQVVETMRERNLAHDPEAAAALVQSRMPKPKPASARSSLLAPNLDIYGMQSAKADERYEKLHSRPWDFFNDECVSVFDEHAEAGL